MSIPVQTPPAADIVVHSAVLGSFTVSTDDIISFPVGILGFPDCRRFALVSGGGHGLFWLQSIDHPTLAFLTIDPFAVVPNFAADIPDIEAATLGARTASDVALLAIVTLPRAPGEEPTANLQGPIAVNFRTRVARQVVTGDTTYGVRWSFRFPAAA